MQNKLTKITPIFNWGYFLLKNFHSNKGFFPRCVVFIKRCNFITNKIGRSEDNYVKVHSCFQKCSTKNRKE